jgi:hypothetical protein
LVGERLGAIDFVVTEQASAGLFTVLEFWLSTPTKVFATFWDNAIDIEGHPYDKELDRQKPAHRLLNSICPATQ